MNAEMRRDQGVLYITLADVVTDDVLMRAVQALVDDPDFSLVEPHVWDFRSAQAGELGSILALMEKLPRVLRQRTGRTAILVHSDFGFGVSRQAQSVLTNPNVKVFRNPEPGEVEAFLLKG